MPRSNETILEDTVAAKQVEYKENEKERPRHLAARFNKCYQKHVTTAQNKYRKEQACHERSVLVDKHFAWIFMDFIKEHNLDPLSLIGIAFANNPQKPSYEFYGKWNNELEAMKTELETLGRHLVDDIASLDYVVWLHEQGPSHSRMRGNTVHISIFGPDEYGETDDYIGLFNLAVERIDGIKKQIHDALYGG
jgi:hypothetical protein